MFTFKVLTSNTVLFYKEYFKSKVVITCSLVDRAIHCLYIWVTTGYNSGCCVVNVLRQGYHKGIIITIIISFPFSITGRINLGRKREAKSCWLGKKALFIPTAKRAIFCCLLWPESRTVHSMVIKIINITAFFYASLFSLFASWIYIHFEDWTVWTQLYFVL